MEIPDSARKSFALNLSAGLVCIALLLPILTQAGRWLPAELSQPVRVFCGFLIIQLPLLLAFLLPFLLLMPIRMLPSELGLKKLTRKEWETIGIHILAVFLIVTLLSTGCSALARRLGCKEPTQEIIELLMNSSWKTFFAIAFSSVLIAPAIEELAFRNILYRCFSGFLPQKAAIAGVSLFFAAIHLTPWQIPPLFLLALILQMEYIRSGGKTSMTILLHTGFNFMTIAAAFIMRLYIAWN